MAESSKIRQLTSRQRLAVAALSAGATDAEAAKCAKVTRQTVNLWKMHNPLFIKALREEQNRLRLEGSRKLVEVHRQLKEAALETILKGIRTGDLVSARWLLEKYHLSDDAKSLKDYELSQESGDESLEVILLDMAKARVKRTLDREGVDAFEREALEQHMVKRAYGRLYKEYVTMEIDR